MAKALKTVGIIAGAVALVATGVGAFAVAGSALAATAASVAGIATVVGGVANIGAAAIGQKPPPERGSVTETVVEVDARTPYVMGEGYVGGVLRSRAGYGATLKDVPNPYLSEVFVYSRGGPIEGPITPYFDFAPVSSWYSGFFESDTQLGATPEASALVPPYGAAPNWTASHKLSGHAAILWNHKFDKDGERYASGLPVRGGHAKWVKVYDPRQDSTFPGGSGPCRLGDESTYVWAGLPGDGVPAGQNPALHAGTYAYGRYENGKRVLGMGLSADAVRFDQIAAWANDCAANGWTIFGRVFEPGDRWANLTDICAAGGGVPVPLHVGVGFHWDRPRVVLDTITEDDLAGEVEVTAMQSWRDRINTIVPKCTVPSANWQFLPVSQVQSAAYLVEDGEERRETWPFNLVDDEAQAGQLAAYKLANSREFYPVHIVCKPRMKAYRPGDCLQIDLLELAGLDTPAVILERDIDPATMEVTLTLIGETAAKHAYALGETATAPPTPSLGQTAQERDQLAAAVIRPPGYTATLIRNVAIKNPRDASDVTRLLLLASEASSVVTISVAKIDLDYPGEDADITFAVEDITTLNDGSTPIGFETLYYVYLDYDPVAGGSPTYGLTTSAFAAQNSTTYPLRHALGYVVTPADGSGGTTDGTSDGGFSYDPNREVP